MIPIVVELDLGTANAAAAAEPAAQPPEGSLLDALTAWWAVNILEPFLALPAHQRLDPMTVDWIFLDQPTTFEVRFDVHLLEDLLETYAAFGWPAVEEVGRRLEELPQIVQPAKELFTITRNTVAAFIGYGLIEVERRAIAFARVAWKEAGRKLTGYLDAFNVVGLNVEHASLADRKVAEEVFECCRGYAVAAAKARRLGEEIARRNRIDPPERRVKGSGQELWFQAYAEPHLAAVKQMQGYAARVAAVLPPAVLVLDDVPDEVLTAATGYRRRTAALKLEDQIYRTVQGMLEDLRTLNDSLTKPGATDALAQRLNPILAEPRDFTSLRRLSLAKGGVEQEAMDVALGRTDDGDQRLLANADLLLALLNDSAYVTPGSWEQVVLYQYCQRLSEKLAERKRSDERWATFWRWLGRAVALLGLIALMAYFPFGGTAVAPVLASALALAGSVATIAGLALLVLHDVIGTLQKTGEVATDARDQLFRLSQTDPDAVREIGQLLSQSRALRDAVTRGLLVTVLTLGASRRLKTVTVALDFHAFAGDVQTLFEPDPPDG